MNKKIENVWSILCEKSVIDSESNNISFTNILEEIQVTPKEGTKLSEGFDSSEKSIPMAFELVTMWKRVGEGDVKELIRVELVDPNGKSIAFGEHTIEMAKSLKRLRFRIRFNGLKVTIPGDYRFVVKIKQGNTYKEVGFADLEIKIALPKRSQ